MPLMVQHDLADFVEGLRAPLELRIAMALGGQP